MAADMNAIHVGIFVLHAGDDEYVCTSARIQMTLNAIPVADVTIGNGAYIQRPAGRKQGDPEKLLKAVLARRKATDYDMLPCSIEEVIAVGGTKQSSKTVFKGIITACSPIYRAGTRTTKMLQVTCMNAAAVLYTNPVAAYISMRGGEFIRHFMYKADPSSDTPINRANEYGDVNSAFDALAKVAVEDGIDIQSADTTVLERFDVCLSLVLEPHIRKGEFASKGKRYLKKYMHSDWALSKDIKDLSLFDYNKMILVYLTKVMGGSAIYPAILKVATSDEYMLNIAPRVDAGGKETFKLDLCPTQAWDTDAAVTLYADDVIGIQTNYSVVDYLDAPNAFMVNFAEPISYGTGQDNSVLLGAVGGYSPIDEIQKKLDDPDYTTSFDDLVKAKLYTAPQWLFPEFNGALGGWNKSGEKADESVAKEKVPATAPDSPADPAADATIDIAEMQKKANGIAKALYAFLYGAQDKATLILQPNLRFGGLSAAGHLENSIGKVVDIYINKARGSNSKLSDDVVNIRGMLESVLYEYTYGTAGTVSYKIVISRVRPLDKNEQKIENTLYRLKKS